MKRYIRSSKNSVNASSDISPELEEFNRKLTSDPELHMEIVQRADEVGFGNRGGYIYIFKAADGTEVPNVYRVFADDVNNDLIFQYIAEAFYVGGEEYYDEAVDVANTSDTPISEWYDLVKYWVELAEVNDPGFTHYEFEE